MKKKKSLLLLGTLFSLLLASCGGAPAVTSSEPSSEEPSSEDTSVNPLDEIVLEKDLSPNYVLDNTSTNENGSVSYEIFVRSFYDGDGNGIGDFKGVEKKLPYLASLGVKTLWLMPIHPSPSYHGYDVTDYYGVHPDFGTLADFDSLTAKAEEYNIDIMIDMVLNHSSNKHPWFQQSHDDYVSNNTGEDSKANYYNWSTKDKVGYNKYSNGLYYEARFDSGMPDLNLDEPKVLEEIENITKFWIEHGVDGFRLDAVLYYYYNNHAANAEFLTWLEETAHKYDPDFYMVGECWSSANIILKYYASKCDSFFNFAASSQPSDSSSKTLLAEVVRSSTTRAYYGANIKWGTATQSYEAKIKEANPNGYASYFLTNHDADRSSKTYQDEFAKTAYSLYGLMPGTPFIYYGEEIGLLGVRINSPDDYNDVRRRLPMVWSKSDKTGECSFPDKTRPDLDNNVQVELGAEDLLDSGYSLTDHYRKVSNVRNKYPIFKHGVFTSMVEELDRTDNQYVVAYKISLGDDYIIVVHNFNSFNVVLPALGTEILDEINTIQLKPTLTDDGKLGLGAFSTVIMH